jgi:DNA-binding NtrC family response regulator
MKAALQHADSVPRPLTRKSILVVEPDPESQLVLKMLLTEEGYEVITCSKPTAAIEIAGVTKFDLVITAHSAPDIDGLSLLETFKQLHAHIPVVVISSHNENEPYSKAMGLGALHFFTKPIDYVAIQELVRSHTI